MTYCRDARAYATSGIPTDEQVERILDALSRGPQSLGGLEADTGIRRGRLYTLLKILAVARDLVTTSSTEATGRAWYFDDHKWSDLRRVRSAEADLMRRYAHGDGCLMQFLQAPWTTRIRGRVDAARCATAAYRRRARVPARSWWRRQGGSSAAAT